MLQYEIEGKIAVVTGCSATDTELEIPEYYEGNPVGKVKEGAFSGAARLRKISFPRTMRLIGAYAFSACKNLKEIFFSEGLETIEDWAFISCAIEELTLPTTIKSIGENAFMGNVVKPYIDEYITSINKTRHKIEGRRNNLTIFPMGLFDSIDNISNDIIQDRSKYHYGQIDAYESGTVTLDKLDIPFAFDGEKLLLAVYSQSEKKNFKIEVTGASRKKMGLYEYSDPDFLPITFNVYAGDENLGEQTIKTPYLEDAKFIIEDVITKEDRGNIYFLVVRCDLSCFGNANPNSEFKFNIFDELKGKYLAQYQRSLISEVVYEDIIAQINFEAIDALKSYLSQVIGSPILTYVLNMFEALNNDEEFEAKDKLNKYMENNFNGIYNSIGSFETFEEACFGLDKVLNYLPRLTGLKLNELKDKYGIYLSDDEGNELTLADMKAYKEVFVENEYNFTLYADYLNYMYQLMQRMNQEFSMRTYQE